MAEIKLMKGNEAIAYGAMLCGCDAYFGYPITPQSEILETLTEQQPWETTGMVVLQAESETAAINMLYGAACTGKRCMTSSSSPGISLMSEGISYIAGAELPCLIVNVSRGGPGLGTIQPSQADYFQATKAAGHGDFHLIVLAPASVQEMHDFVALSFDLAFKYRNPVMILVDGVVGQMMEKVKLSEQRPRWTDDELLKMQGEWALTGKSQRERHIVTSLDLDPVGQDNFNRKLIEKYKQVRQNEVRYEEYLCDDAEYLMVAYGISARIAQKSTELLRAEGVKVGVLRPITLFPFPTQAVAARVPQLKGILSVEMSAGQMIEDIRLAVGNALPVQHYGRMGGMIHNPTEVTEAFKGYFVK
ncbi:3-methyl-2-oxobutanoate dehydrogenase subunit VorB [Bacteroidia bacterium]|nr:3-methyl-2-oxobutanoate dehydrogenase subunit VorB [Bacteroidia bacterium]